MPKSQKQEEVGNLPYLEATKNMRIFLENALFSGHLYKESPVSALLVAAPESGKTRSMWVYGAPTVNKGVAWVNDATAYGILRDYGANLVSGELRHLLIPDLVNPLSRKQSTVNSFVAFMNSLVEEGVVKLSTYAASNSYEKPVNCGLIAAVTPGLLSDQRHSWERMGFMSRMLPFSYSYNPATIDAIFESIITGKSKPGTGIKLRFPKTDADIQLDPELARECLPLSKEIAQARASYGFRLQRQAQALLKANALRCGRKSVTDADVKTIQEVLKWVNLKCRPLE